VPPYAADLPTVLLVLGAAALVGIGLGFGLVVGAFVARALRRYMSAEGFKPYDRPDEHR